MARTATDAFTRADSGVTLGSADTGQAWTYPGGTWGISSNKAYCPTLGSASVWPGPGGHAVVDLGATIQSAQIDITALGGASAATGLVAKYTGIGDFWTAFVLNTGGSPFLYAGKVVAGTATYSIVSAVALGAGPWTIQLVFNDDHTVSVFVNGVLKGTSATDTFNLLATKVGLLAGNANSAGQAVFDNLSVQPTPVWDVDIESFTGLPSAFGLVANGAAPTGWSAAGGVLTGVTSTTDFWAYDGPVNSADRTVELECKVNGNPGGSLPGSTFGQWFAIGNQTRYIDIGLYSAKIQVNDNGVNIDLPLDMTVWRKIRATMAGTSFKLYVDNALFYTRTIVRTFANSACLFGQGSAATSGNWNQRALRVSVSSALSPVKAGIWGMPI